MQSVNRKDCPMRHENGNCTVAGGFCTAVNEPICEALHNAFECGEQSKIEWTMLTLAKQRTAFEEEQLEVLRKIHKEVTASPSVVARGRWINVPPYTSIGGDYLKAQECSECRAFYVSEGNKPYSNHNYCPNCGAKMDLEG